MKSITTTIVLVFILISIGIAQVIRVPGEMGVIQDALNACLPGDTVLVSPGIYYENLVWPNTQSICLISELGPDTTIIDGSDTARVILVSTGVDTTTIISGFTIRNGYSDFGAGIGCMDSSSPKIADNIITQNTAELAGGIGCSDNSSPVIINNTVTGNNSNGMGGIGCSHTTSVIIKNNIISNNNAGAGGGIGLDECSSIIITYNVITANTATDGYGGGVLAFDCGEEIIIDDNTITNNWGDVGGGGILIILGGSANISNNFISGNIATTGGGIGVGGSQTTISGNTINANIALLGGGIGFHGSESTIYNNTISDNTADSLGGGIYCEDNSNLSMENVTVSQNTAEESGGGIESRYSNLQIENCNFTGNLAQNGYGGAINYWNFGNSSKINYQVGIKNSQISNNIAGFHTGGVYIVVSNTDSSFINVLIDKCEFVNNSSDHYTALHIGGFKSLFEVSNCVFRSNIAVQYTAGASFHNGCTGMVSNCLFTLNTAATGGGSWNSGGAGVWAWANVNFMNCTFSDNSASYGSGLGIGRGSVVTATNCIFWGNSIDQIALITYNNEGGTLIANYCDVQGGEDSINVIDPGSSTLNWGDGNIEEDPLFIDSGNSDYHLKDSSACINAAIDSIEIAGLWSYCPLSDIEGNSRPNPPGSMPDMGAYESPVGIVGVEEDELIQPTEYILFQNYPNPFNPTTKIEYQIPELSIVTLKVYDVLGSEIRTLVNEEKPVGDYEVEFNAANLSSGIYIYQLSAGEFIKTKKMIIIK